MARRNFIIVDDMPSLGDKVNRVISQYYTSKRIYEYDIKQFTADSHFNDALYYVKNMYDDIDVIFSDQNLRGGNGTDIFKAADNLISTDYISIIGKTKIFKVMHSNEDKRLKEYQDEYSFAYNYFVNSDSERDIVTFLDFYEKKIIPEKATGNNLYNKYLYANPTLQHDMNTARIVIDKQELSIKDILFLIMDKNESKSEYYYFIYNDNERISKSKKSKKTDVEFNNTIKSLSFLNGILHNGNREKFKINPLWISSIDSANSVIKLLPLFNIQYEISFEKLSTQINIIENSREKFFL